VLDVWDEAGEAVARHGPAYTGASERHIPSTRPSTHPRAQPEP